jgi:hypothetical protein
MQGERLSLQTDLRSRGFLGGNNRIFEEFSNKSNLINVIAWLRTRKHVLCEVTTTLRFQEPLTPAAKYLVDYSLKGAEDELRNYDADDWAATFPRSAACFSLELAVTTMADLREKLDRPEFYQLTNYHWLLLYEALQLYLAILNDYQIAEENHQLLTLASRGDGYLKFRRRRGRPSHVTIDFGWFVDKFFWDTDFLELPGVYDQLGPEAKRQLGMTPETFGVIHGMAPHPDELRLEVWTEEERIPE